jgi:hypothetical protein
MKTLQALLIGAALFAVTGAFSQAQAHPDGYWDRDGHWRHYEHHHDRYGDHEGYWDQRDGARVFISL